MSRSFNVYLTPFKTPSHMHWLLHPHTHGIWRKWWKNTIIYMCRNLSWTYSHSTCIAYFILNIIMDCASKFYLLFSIQKFEALLKESQRYSEYFHYPHSHNLSTKWSKNTIVYMWKKLSWNSHSKEKSTIEWSSHFHLSLFSFNPSPSSISTHIIICSIINISHLIYTIIVLP